jgi:hypothetical protein
VHQVEHCVSCTPCTTLNRSASVSKDDIVLTTSEAWRRLLLIRRAEWNADLLLPQHHGLTPLEIKLKGVQDLKSDLPKHCLAWNLQNCPSTEVAFASHFWPSARLRALHPGPSKEVRTCLLCELAIANRNGGNNGCREEVSVNKRPARAGSWLALGLK